MGGKEEKYDPNNKDYCSDPGEKELYGKEHIKSQTVSPLTHLVHFCIPLLWHLAIQY